MNDPKQQEEVLFEAARRLIDPFQRGAFLDAACAGNTALRSQLCDLLAAQEHAEKLFCPLPHRHHDAEVNPTVRANGPGIAEQSGTVIGRYKLLQKIGEGGCGIVYMAEQSEPVKRRVALKVIKLGMDTKSVIARFEAERQALALMDHPNIARVFDAGATETGRPYFVMELVRGVKITEYCDETKLPTRERLELFIKVCQAIQHAHQKGVIHRDILNGGTLRLNAATASWQMAHGTLKGGMVKQTEGAKLLFDAPNAMNTFDGMNVEGDLELMKVGARALIRNGLSIIGSVVLDNTGAITFAGDQTFNTGQVVFAGTPGILGIEPGTTLTLGPAMVVRGKSGNIGQGVFAFSGTRKLINQGSISADVAGGTITINPTQFENPGTLRADGSGASVVVRVSPFTNTGAIEELNGGKVLINP